MIRLSERNITSNLFTAGPLAYTERSTNLAEMQVKPTPAGIHSIRGYGVIESRLDDPTYAKRLERVYRPVP